MDWGQWINPIFAIVTWVIMFLVVDKKRVIYLMPVGLLAAVLLFVAQEMLISLGLLKYQKGLLLIMGIPSFQFLWAIAAGIIFISFMKEEWSMKLPIIVAAIIINEILVYIAQSTGNLTFLRGYNIWYDSLLTFVGFSFGVWAAEGLFKDQIYGLSKRYS